MFLNLFSSRARKISQAHPAAFTGSNRLPRRGKASGCSLCQPGQRSRRSATQGDLTMLAGEQTEKLVDLIYDAALDNDLWREVLTQIADLTESEGGVLFGQ